MTGIMSIPLRAVPSTLASKFDQSYGSPGCCLAMSKIQPVRNMPTCPAAICS